MNDKTVLIKVDARLRANEEEIGDYLAAQYEVADKDPNALRFGDGYRRWLIVDYALNRVAEASDEQIIEACQGYNTMVYVKGGGVRASLSLPNDIYTVLELFADRLMKMAKNDQVAVKNTREDRNLRMAVWVAIEVAARMIEAEREITP